MYRSGEDDHRGTTPDVNWNIPYVETKTIEVEAPFKFEEEIEAILLNALHEHSILSFSIWINQGSTDEQDEELKAYRKTIYEIVKYVPYKYLEKAYPQFRALIRQIKEGGYENE